MALVLITRDEVREEFAEQNITPANITDEQLKELMKCIRNCLKNEEGFYNGTGRLNQKKPTPYLTIRTDQWESREAVSFNKGDNFIGFAGWASEKNVQPILRASRHFLGLNKAGFTREERLAVANEFMKVIATCGRRFYSKEDYVGKHPHSFLELHKGRYVYFNDWFTGARININGEEHKDWRGFTEGGTMKSFTVTLRDFVLHGHRFNRAYFDYQDDYDRHFWGYDKASIKKVQNEAYRLGLINKS